MPHYYMIYDDQCPMCLDAIERVRKLDELGVVTLVPLSNPALPPPLLLPPTEQLEKAMHVIDSDGNVSAGADAVARLATLFPKSRLLGRLMMLPGVKQLARVVYGIVARNRLKLK